MQFTFIAQGRIPQRGPRLSPSLRLIEPQFCTLANVVPPRLSGEETLVSSPLPVLFLAFPENGLE